VPSEFKTVLRELDPEADIDKVVQFRREKPTGEEVEAGLDYQWLKRDVDEKVNTMREYEDSGKSDYDYEDQLEEIRAEINMDYERLHRMFDRRDRIEINLTPKMIEAIKNKKLTKYFQGGRVE
jgi:aminoglycoside phosphotransferase family enzyme